MRKQNVNLLNVLLFILVIIGINLGLSGAASAARAEGPCVRVKRALAAEELPGVSLWLPEV